jgi:hypothetical protein
MAYVFVLWFSSWSSEMQFDVIQLETWASTEYLIAFRILEFILSFFDFSRAHIALNYFPLCWPLFVVPCVEAV